MDLQKSDENRQMNPSPHIWKFQDEKARCWQEVTSVYCMDFKQLEAMEFLGLVVLVYLHRMPA